MSPPRRRSRNNEKLPPYVYKKRGCYVLVSYDPETRKQSSRRLCGEQASLAEIWQAYDEFHGGGMRGTFRWLSEQFQASPQFDELSDNTKSQYRMNHKAVCNMELTDGRALGEIPLTSWTPPIVRKFLDRRAQDAPVRANRDKAYISRVFKWGRERGMVKDNPAQGVRRIKEKSRTRYVADGEYLAVMEMAADSGSPYIVPVMELAYLLRARLCEVLDLRREDCTEEGIFLRRRKGSKDAIIEWGPRLTKAVEAAKALHGPIASRYLIPGADYGRMKESTVQSAWQRLMKKHSEQGGERYHIHDLKGKGVTDTEGDKLAASGHKDPRMLAVYDRLPAKVKPTR